ncbi:glycosyl hydrolase [Globomyces pollinis-pini]|nr:glycosyl hydrolase [Globomyces pollinis-pini]
MASDSYTINMKDYTLLPNEEPNNRPLKPSFQTFRPIYHFQPPKNWMNDPNAPMLINGTYHMYYQFNPWGVGWGNMHWGHATSTDMLTWKDQPIALSPSVYYDKSHVYSGMGISKGYKGLPTIFYTGITDHGREVQALAVSHDEGYSWVDKLPNPIISTPPKNYSPNCWRDPYVFQSTVLDDAFAKVGKSNPESYYLLLGSGENNVGGRILLYQSTDMVNWIYQPHPYFAATDHYSFNKKFSPPFGPFLEMPNHARLSTLDKKTSLEFLFVSETRATLVPWIAGDYVEHEGSIQLQPLMIGALDWGMFYASEQFYDEPNDRFVIWGWVTEDDNGVDRDAKGWAGMLGLPREIYLLQTNNVVNRKKKYNEKGSWLINESKTTESLEIVELQTLGIRPMKGINNLAQTLLVNISNMKFQGMRMFTEQTKSFSIDTELTIQNGMSPIFGFIVRANSKHEEETRIVYDQVKNEVRIIRQKSSLNRRMIHHDEVGPFELYEISNDGIRVDNEKLHIQVFVDNSIIEVFINDRFALTTRIYPTLDDSQLFGVFVEEPGVTFDSFVVRSNFKSVFPDRVSQREEPMSWWERIKWFFLSLFFWYKKLFASPAAPDVP